MIKPLKESYIINRLHTFPEKNEKQLNHDLQNLLNWLNANKIPLDISKTELVEFSPPKKQLDHELKIKLCGEKLLSD